MRVLESTLMRMFGRPTGTLGKLGGMIMARSNAAFARCVINLLEVQPTDKVLEVGFGPGVGIQLLANSAPAGRVAGVDCSKEMLEQAKARNAEAIERGVFDLRRPRSSRFWSSVAGRVTPMRRDGRPRRLHPRCRWRGSRDTGDRARERTARCGRPGWSECVRDLRKYRRAAE